MMEPIKEEHGNSLREAIRDRRRIVVKIGSSSLHMTIIPHAGAGCTVLSASLRPVKLPIFV